MTYADGGKYVGGFKDGKRDGQGMVYSPTGAVIAAGSWADGKLVPDEGKAKRH